MYIVKLYFHYGSGDGLKLRLRNIGAYNKMLYVLAKLWLLLYAIKAVIRKQSTTVM